MNKDLLKSTKALVEALENDQALAAEVTGAALGDEGGVGGPEGELPPPPEDEMSDLPPEMGAEGGAPEDEALGLLRDIAAGISRMADELAPVEAEAEVDLEKEGEDPEAEEAEEKAEHEEPGVPPVEDDDDFAETMPVASGA